MVQVLSCGNLDLKKINDDLIAYGNSAWIGAEVDEKIYLYKSNPNEQYTGYVLLKFSSECVATPCLANTPKEIQWALSAPLESIKQNPSNDFAFGNEGFGEGYSSTLRPVQSIPETQSFISNITDQPMQGIDYNSMNDFGFAPAAVRPLGAVIPMRSNVVCYGPWVSSNFWTSPGGVDVSVDPDLSPWTFGSKANVQSVGNTIVEFNRRGLTKAEAGSVTVPGLPASGDISKLGSGVGDGSSGPNLTSINFSLGIKGITTTYEFKTYTPKFGKLSKLFIDKYKNNHKQRLTQLRMLRNQQSNQNKLYRKIAARAARESIRTKNNSKTSEGMARVLVGTMTDWYNNHTGQKSSVGLCTLKDVSLESTRGYENKAFMSLDGIFSPVSLYGDGNLPRYAQTDGGEMQQPILPLPPFEGENRQQTYINNQNYNPIQNPGHPYSASSSSQGHSVDIVGRGQEIPSDGLMNSFYAAWDTYSKYSEDYRFIAMRGPLVLHSWGYDTEGYPIPNLADNNDDASVGNFSTDDLEDKFLGDWLQKPKTWPVAPVDLRFDRQRGLWVTPQPYRIIIAKLTEHLIPKKWSGEGIAYAKIVNDNLNDPSDNPERFEDKQIVVVDRIGLGLRKDTKVYVYFDTTCNKYIIMNAATFPKTITGIADGSFDPNSTSAKIRVRLMTDSYEEIKIDDVIDCENPLAFGANDGDYVVAHLSITDAEIKYIIYSTGKLCQEF